MTDAPTPTRLPGVRRLALALLLVDVVAFLIQGANRPARPSLAPPTPVTQSAVPTTTPSTTLSAAASVTITPAVGQGRPSTRCFLVAATPQQRARGLMGRRSLGGYEGMAFVYTADSNDSYYMRSTLFPLAIAFFSRAGLFLSSASMLPCPATATSCPQYSAAGPFRLALEVPIGQLRALGVGAGTGAHLGGPCSP
ncbi:MAG: DUF192 domain-containing protein [Actinomycetota bacterium]|nr:DUF192 domain-containing protein [Actinomycetota bacterium]